MHKPARKKASKLVFEARDAQNLYSQSSGGYVRSGGNECWSGAVFSPDHDPHCQAAACLQPPVFPCCCFQFVQDLHTKMNYVQSCAIYTSNSFMKLAYNNLMKSTRVCDEVVNKEERIPGQVVMIPLRNQWVVGLIPIANVLITF